MHSKSVILRGVSVPYTISIAKGATQRCTSRPPPMNFIPPRYFPTHPPIPRPPSHHFRPESAHDEHSHLHHSQPDRPRSLASVRLVSLSPPHCRRQFAPRFFHRIGGSTRTLWYTWTPSPVPRFPLLLPSCRPSKSRTDPATQPVHEAALYSTIITAFSHRLTNALISAARYLFHFLSVVLPIWLSLKTVLCTAIRPTFCAPLMHFDLSTGIYGMCGRRISY